MPGRHPDDDVLADLAADVLPVDQAREVEAHVLACDRCASLLSDAEHVRGLLLADDPGPVPPEIWNRIEAALLASHDSSPPGGRAHAEPFPPPPPPPRERRVDSSGRSGWDDASPDPLDDPDDWSTVVRPAVAVPAAAAQGPRTASVRGISTSRRETRTDRRRGPGPLLLGAAAAVVLVLAVGAVRLVQDRRDASTEAALAGSAAGSSAAAGGAVAAAGITRSGADYTKATLEQRARALVRGTTLTTANQGPVGTSAATTEPRAGGVATASVPPDPKATDVTNPQRLAACLSGLGASADAVVAVDLARYEGREAAVLVLRTPTGYEVWVVARTCDAADQGALAEKMLAS